MGVSLSSRRKACRAPKRLARVGLIWIAVLLAAAPASRASMRSSEGALKPEELGRLAERVKNDELTVLSVESGSQRKRLKLKSRYLKPSSPGVGELISHLEKTVRHLGGMGIAAPQVGIPVRLALVQRIGKDGNRRFEPLLNPQVLRRSRNRLASWENCLSVPWGYRFTERASKITLQFQTPTGRKIKETLKGEEAVLLQHELDHLNGKVLSGRFRRAWFIPPDEIAGFANEVQSRCAREPSRLCAKFMKQAWISRHAFAVKPNR